MRKMLIGATLLAITSEGTAQTQNSTTNCSVIGSTLNCNSTTQSNPGVDWNAYNQQQQRINQQNQQNMNQSMQNLGTAIAADRERRKVKRAEKEIAEAMSRDPDPAPAPPPVEPPILLACTVNNGPVSVTLYPNSGRADVTSGGISKMRAATFTRDTVTWTSPIYRTAISRVDLSLVSIALLPSMKGVQMTGSCSLAERKF
ncbi:MAG: hypothetical protein ABI626_05355 [Sphingomicrobium sp.]